ncbi:MAG: carboxylating nicotinate-nucleotide diphosphorylase [Pseudomonadota bacterium]
MQVVRQAIRRSHIVLSHKEHVTADVRRALEEDVGPGDINAQLIPAEATAEATVITREPAVLAGVDWVSEVFQQLDEHVKITWHAGEGRRLEPEQTIFTLKGPTRALLTGERCALNFLQAMSGTATVVRAYVDMVSGTGVTLLDTRKTIPGLRYAQKHAVTCGGGQNHRMGLYDAFLIKENHIMAAGSITQAVAAAKQLAPKLPVRIEVENQAELEEAVAAKVDAVLLDNFSIAQLKQAVDFTQGRCKLEASGGITQKALRGIAETGVDYISIGALTKDLRAIDLSMRLTQTSDVSA